MPSQCLFPSLPLGSPVSCASCHPSTGSRGWPGNQIQAIPPLLHCLCSSSSSSAPCCAVLASPGDRHPPGAGLWAEHQGAVLGGDRGLCPKEPPVFLVLWRRQPVRPSSTLQGTQAVQGRSLSGQHLIPSSSSDHQPCATNPNSVSSPDHSPERQTVSPRNPGYDVPSASTGPHRIPNLPLGVYSLPDYFLLMKGSITPPLMRAGCVTSLSPTPKPSQLKFSQSCLWPSNLPSPPPDLTALASASPPITWPVSWTLHRSSCFYFHPPHPHTHRQTHSSLIHYSTSCSGITSEGFHGSSLPTE